MLRALTIIVVAIGIAFLAWSLMVMSGGRDWLMTSRTAGDQGRRHGGEGCEGRDGEARRRRDEPRQTDKPEADDANRKTSPRTQPHRRHPTRRQPMRLRRPKRPATMRKA